LAPRRGIPCGLLDIAVQVDRGKIAAPAFVAGRDDIAMAGEPGAQGRGHFAAAANVWPFANGEIGGNGD